MRYTNKILMISCVHGLHGFFCARESTCVSNCRVGATTKRFRKPRLRVGLCGVLNAIICVHKYSMQVFLYLIHDYILYISPTCLTLRCTGHMLVRIQKSMLVLRFGVDCRCLPTLPIRQTKSINIT